MNASLMKRKWLNASAALLLTVVGGGTALVAPRPAQAQLAVVCANCSDIITQIMSYVQQLLQLSKQIEQYALQIRQYENMVKNTKNLPRSFFDRAIGTVRNIEATLQRGTNISYAAQDLDNTFRRLFPDYQSVYSSVQYMDESQSINDQARRSREAMDAALTTLQAAKQQSDSMAGEQAAMDAIGSDLMNADGNLDALQAMGEFAQHSANQLMRMRQIGLMQVQLQSAQIAQQQRDQDLARAAQQRWVENKPATRRGSPNTSTDYVR